MPQSSKHAQPDKTADRQRMFRPENVRGRNIGRENRDAHGIGAKNAEKRDTLVRNAKKNTPSFGRKDRRTTT